MSNMADVEGVPSQQRIAAPYARAYADSHAVAISPDDASRPKATFREHTSVINVCFAEAPGKVGSTELTKKIENAKKVFNHAVGRAAAHDVRADNNELTAMEADLSKGIITKIAISGLHNDFPFPVSIDCTGLGKHSNNFSTEGNQHGFTIPPTMHHSVQPVTIYSAENATQDPLIQRYGHMRPSDLWEGVTPIKGSDKCLVVSTHPALSLMRLNSQKWPQIPERNMEGFVTLPYSVIKEINQEMDASVLEKMRFHDLNNFMVKLARSDNRAFNDPVGSQYEHLSAPERAAVFSKNCFAGCNLHITWTVPESSAAPLAAPAAPVAPRAQVPSQVPVPQWNAYPTSHPYPSYAATPSQPQKLPMSTPARS